MKSPPSAVTASPLASHHGPQLGRRVATVVAERSVVVREEALVGGDTHEHDAVGFEQVGDDPAEERHVVLDVLDDVEKRDRA